MAIEVAAAVVTGVVGFVSARLHFAIAAVAVLGLALCGIGLMGALDHPSALGLVATFVGLNAVGQLSYFAGALVLGRP